MENQSKIKDLQFLYKYQMNIREYQRATLTKKKLDRELAKAKK